MLLQPASKQDHPQKKFVAFVLFGAFNTSKMHTKALAHKNPSLLIIFETDSTTLHSGLHPKGSDEST
jgi:hypothetical protein